MLINRVIGLLLLCCSGLLAQEIVVVGQITMLMRMGVYCPWEATLRITDQEKPVVFAVDPAMADMVTITMNDHARVQVLLRSGTLAAVSSVDEKIIKMCRSRANRNFLVSLIAGKK